MFSRTESSIEPGTWPRLRDAGFVKLQLDVLEIPKKPSARTAPDPWKISLVRLADAMNELDKDKDPRAKAALQLVKDRFPRIASANTYPFSCITENQMISPATVSICSSLALMARSDPSLLSAMQQYNLVRTALISWLTNVVDYEDSRYYFVDPPRFLSVTQACVNVVRVLDNRKQTVVPIVIEDLTALRSAELLTNYFRRPSSAKPKELEGLFTLGERMLDCQELPKHLVGFKTPFFVTVSLWQAILPTSPGDCREALRLGYRFFLNIFRSQTDDTRNAFVAEMIRLCEFFGLCATGLYVFAQGSSPLDLANSPVLSVMDWVAEVCKIRQDLIGPHIRPSLLSTWDLLRDLDEREHPGRPLAIDAWSKVAAACGATELELRRLEALKPRSGGLTGCSWYQCPLHGGEFEGAVQRMMFLDHNCQTVQYCSRFCQKSDWHQGEHKLNCPAR